MTESDPNGVQVPLATFEKEGLLDDPELHSKVLNNWNENPDAALVINSDERVKCRLSQRLTSLS
jgi:hypothetical protein